MKTTEDFQAVVDKLSQNYLIQVIKTLDNLIAENNIKKTQNESHKLKGSGTTYGFSQISLKATEIEDLCKSLLTAKSDQIHKNKTIINKKVQELRSLTKTYQEVSLRNNHD